MPNVYYELNFNDSINTSCQVGDMVYYLNQTSATGGFVFGDASDLIQVGPVNAVLASSIIILIDNSIVSTLSGAYIMFAKDKTVNTSSLIGYYAEAKFVNDSSKKIELFSVGSEVTESSK